MLLGLLTDIHEHVEHLTAALARLQQLRVDQVMLIGDVAATGERICKTCALLAGANAVGVWGNHDYGLCLPTDQVRAKYSRSALDYLAMLRPRYEIEGCYFAHVEPWLDPEVIADLWYFDGVPDEPSKLARIFAAVPHRVIFAGHFHSWLRATPDRLHDWAGQESICLAEGRHFVVVGALCDGHFATFDTVTSELTPLRIE